MSQLGPADARFYSAIDRFISYRIGIMIYAEFNFYYNDFNRRSFKMQNMCHIIKLFPSMQTKQGSSKITVQIQGMQEGVTYYPKWNQFTIKTYMGEPCSFEQTKYIWSVSKVQHSKFQVIPEFFRKCDQANKTLYNGYVSQMQDSKIFQEIPEFFRECYQANQEQKKAITEIFKNIPESKHCIALIGKTGVGKSCLFEYLLGEQLKPTKFIKGGVFHLEVEEKARKQQQQLIVNGAKSGTQLPNIQQMDKGPHLIDLPGFLDNQGENVGYLNTLRIYETLNLYQEMNFICVIKYEDLNFAQRKDCFNITAFVTMLEKVCQKAGYKKDKQLFIVSCLPQDCVGQTKDDIYTELEEQLDEQYQEDPKKFVKIGEDYQYLKNCFQNRQFYFLIPQNKKHPYQPENLDELKAFIHCSPFYRNQLKKDSLFIDQYSQIFLKVKTKELIDILKEKKRILFKVSMKQFETFRSKIEEKYKKKESLSQEERDESLMFYKFTRKLNNLKDSTLEFSKQSKYVQDLFKPFLGHYRILPDQSLDDIKFLYQILEDLHLSCVHQNIIHESLDGMGLILKENFISQYLSERCDIHRLFEADKREKLHKRVASIYKNIKECKIQIRFD